MSRCKMFGLALIAVLFVGILSSVPAFAEETAAPQAISPAPSSTSFSNCGGSLDLTNLTVQGEICPATQPAPELMAKPPRLRYCTCGCGATCTTDADCGGGRCV
ncbi:MAG TPA: hypothetical protein VIC28_13810, partial [Thermoanaerobaculia bacterium]